MIFKIELLDYNKSWDIDKPLCYRLRLCEKDGEFKLIKQHFKSGFSDGEYFDEWCICKTTTTLSWISIITKRVDDTKYLKELETKIFEIYYDESEKLEKQLKIYLNQQIQYYNNKILYQQEITKFVDKFNRRRKLQQLNNITNNL